MNTEMKKAKKQNVSLKEFVTLKLMSYSPGFRLL